MVNGLKLNTISRVSPDFVKVEPQLKSVNTDLVGRVKYLYQVLSGAPYYTSERSGVTRLLEAGCLMFGADYGLLMRGLSHQVGEVTAVACSPKGDKEVFYVGQHLQIENTLTAKVLERNETCMSKSAPSADGFGEGFKYNGVPVKTYLGTVVCPSSTEPMAVCFFSSTAADAYFGSEDIETIELLAEGVACMIDLQKVQAQRKMTDQAMFALGSVKTLEEYMLQANLPEVYGVPARVLEVLQKRIGHAPLSIGHIAEDLNLSKRTLQRRLQQQDISFAELRDQVRFHYSIDYLIKQHLSIDSISASLDFSDRTSFTNAFKRWTGLSPSTFRKLFRDYV
jgi:AraC-like DNA-binding protein